MGTSLRLTKSLSFSSFTVYLLYLLSPCSCALGLAVRVSSGLVASFKPLPQAVSQHEVHNNHGKNVRHNETDDEIGHPAQA